MELTAPSSSSTNSSSRKDSLIDTIHNTRRSTRKDSVAPLLFHDLETDGERSGKSSLASNPDVVSGTEKARRLSRRLSLKPPPNVYRDRSSPKSSLQINHVRNSQTDGQHIVKCFCGRELQIPCASQGMSNSSSVSSVVPTITLSGVEVTEIKKAFAEHRMPPNTTSSVSETTEASDKKSSTSSLLESIDGIKTPTSDYNSVLKCCMDIGRIDDQDSLEVVLSRQNAIKSLLDATKKFPEKYEVVLEASKSLLKQVKHSEASLHYLTVNDGIERLHNIMRKYAENKELLAIVLDIFGYYSFQEEWRSLLTEKVNPSYFLTTMARHECDVTIVEKCCVVVGNLVLSEDIARSMMYVGGVHSLISMMTKYDHNIDILQNCCTALGTFASHDDTCQAVAEAGATCAVMTVMTSFPTNADIQQGCCWALASLSRSGMEFYGHPYITSQDLQLAMFWKRYAKRQRLLYMTSRRSKRSYFRSDCVCMELMSIDAFILLVKTMETFSSEICIQEYGCWALCNLVVLGSRLEDKDCQSAVEILIDCLVAFTSNVELLEHICYATSTIVALKECVHETVVRRDGVTKLIELMRHYEDNVDIQVNGCKVIGNLAVNVNFRSYVEDMGASEAVISCMLKIDKSAAVQNTGCMTLTNLSAESSDNKFRILKNGGVHAVLVAMNNFTEEEAINLNALKVLSNLLESDKGCWWIAEESGIQIITMALKQFSECSEIVSFGCTCLSNLPRRGMNYVALQSVESTLLYLRQSMSQNVDVARGVCCFYENSLLAGHENAKLLTSSAMKKILQIMQDFDDIEVQISGCKIIAHIAIDETSEVMTRGVVPVLISTMKKFMFNEDIQVVCCGTISYLSSSAKGLKSLQEIWCIDLVLECMQHHVHHVQIQYVCLMTIENMCQANLVRGKNIQCVCDAVSKCMTTHTDNKDIQTGACQILSIIGKEFHKQNEHRRQSVDFLDTFNGVVRRKSVTDEILEVASAAIQRLKRFTEESEESEEDPVEVELAPTNYGLSNQAATSTSNTESET